MPFVESGSLRYFQFDSLARLGPVIHGIFTRAGGVSPSPWDSLNVGSSVGDSRTNVLENTRRALHALGRHTESVFPLWQIHSAEILHVDRKVSFDRYHRADAVLCAEPEITLMMRFADCVPILLYDPGHPAIAMVHAGWKGTVEKLAYRVIQEMVSAFGTDPMGIVAGIGPSIGPDHYQVGEEVWDALGATWGSEAERFLQVDGKGWKLDLWRANRWLLEAAGVRSIEMADLCTACHADDWYSHRRSRGRTGRFGAIMALQG